MDGVVFDRIATLMRADGDGAGYAGASFGHRELLGLETEHDALGHRAAEVEASGCPAPDVVALVRALRTHIESESRAVRSASDVAQDLLTQVPSWRPAESFECAGGPTDTWPGEWLG